MSTLGRGLRVQVRLPMNKAKNEKWVLSGFTWYLAQIMKPTNIYAGSTNERLPLEVLVTAVMSDITSTEKVIAFIRDSHGTSHGTPRYAVWYIPRALHMNPRDPTRFRGIYVSFSWEPTGFHRISPDPSKNKLRNDPAGIPVTGIAMINPSVLQGNFRGASHTGTDGTP